MPNENKLVTLADLGEAYSSLNSAKKNIQSTVSDPTANGSAVAFIDSISQDAQGVITPTKKTVPTATQSADGLMSAADKEKLDDVETTYVAKEDIVNNLTETVSGNVLDATQGKALLDKIKASVVVAPTAYRIAEGTSSAMNVTGLTANHKVVFWGFTGGYSENNPPADITVSTSAGSYTVTVTNLIKSGIDMQPVFIASQT